MWNLICTQAESDYTAYSEIDERESIAKFVIKSRTLYKTTEEQSSGIMDDFFALLDRKLAYSKNLVMTIARAHNLPTFVCTELEHLFVCPSLQQPFARFETKFQQNTFMAENMGLVVCF